MACSSFPPEASWERPVTEPAPTMTVPELAVRCGIDPSTAYRYLRAGQLPGVHVGSGWIIDRQRVERYLAGLEDAQGRPLIQPSPTTDPAVLTLLPERAPATAELATSWLRGAFAAVELLFTSVEQRASAQEAEQQSSSA